MSKNIPLINGVMKSFENGEPMVITAWSDSQRGSMLFADDFWKAAVEWSITKHGYMIKALHLEAERVGVDLYLDEKMDPDFVRHMASAELSAFLRDWIPPHRDCGPGGYCAACFREE